MYFSIRREFANSAVCNNLNNTTTDTIFGVRTEIQSSRRHIRSCILTILFFYKYIYKSLVSSMRVANDIQSMDLSPNYLRNIGNCQVQNCTKNSYYYKIKLIPRPFSMNEGFHIKVFK